MEPLARNIFGYTDRFSVAPGETLSFHVSCEGVSGYEAAVVRLRHGYTGSAGPGFLETEIPSNVAGLYEGSVIPAKPAHAWRFRIPTTCWWLPRRWSSALTSMRRFLAARVTPALAPIA